VDILHNLFKFKKIVTAVFAFAISISLYFMSCIDVRAEETYAYSYDVGYDYVSYDNREGNSSGKYYYTFCTNIPLKIYAFSYDVSGSTGTSECHGKDIKFYVCPEFSSSLSSDYIKLITPFDSGKKSYLHYVNGVPVYFEGFGTLFYEYVSGDLKGNTRSCDWNIPYMNLPEGMSCQEVLFAIYNGDMSYVTQETPDSIETLDSDFYFIGFKGDNYINASWQDVSDRTYMKDINPQYYVSLGFGYAEPTSTEVIQKLWLEQNFDYSLMKLTYDITEYKLKYDDMYLRAVYVVPSYRYPGAGWKHGQPAIIYLKNDGSIDKVVNNEKPIISLISENGVFDDSIPTPRLVTTDAAYECFFSNASDDYYIEMQGRCYTVDDIELFKENAMWKYKYSTILKNNLTSWLDASDLKNSRGGHDLGNYAEESFSKLLKIYPIDKRSYYGGKNSFSNYLFGYDDALDMLKNTFLPNITSAYNGIEIYVRYYTVSEDGSYKYGKWCHWFDDLASMDGSSGSTWDDEDSLHGENQSDNGLTDSEKNNIEDTSDSKNGDKDVISSIVDNSVNLDTTKLFNTLSDLMLNLGQLPQLIVNIIGFLPDWLISLISVSIGLMVIIGIVKAVL